MINKIISSSDAELPTGNAIEFLFDSFIGGASIDKLSDDYLIDPGILKDSILEFIQAENNGYSIRKIPSNMYGELSAGKLYKGKLLD